MRCVSTDDDKQEEHHMADGKQQMARAMMSISTKNGVPVVRFYTQGNATADRVLVATAIRKLSASNGYPKIARLSGK